MLLLLIHRFPTNSGFLLSGKNNIVSGVDIFYEKVTSKSLLCNISSRISISLCSLSIFLACCSIIVNCLSTILHKDLYSRSIVNTLWLLLFIISLLMPKFVQDKSKYELSDELLTVIVWKAAIHIIDCCWTNNIWNRNAIQNIYQPEKDI